jgi:hypothetical protein
MPDEYGFNHLGSAEVRCIDCLTGGPLWKWPVRLRAAHWRTHERERVREQTRAQQIRRREATKRLRAISRLRKETTRA